jgi:hypothetical protein
MKHPTDQEWMDLLYDELSPEQRSELESHIKKCAACTEKRATFRQTHKRLDAWQVAFPEKPRLARQWSPAFKWAAAAALVVSTAFATGRFAKPQFDPERIQAQISKPLEEKISRELNSKLEQQSQLMIDLAARLDQISATREQTARVLAILRERNADLYSLLADIETKRETESRAIREDLEKLAVFTDRNLRTTRNQIGELAALNQPTE